MYVPSGYSSTSGFDAQDRRTSSTFILYGRLISGSGRVVWQRITTFAVPRIRRQFFRDLEDSAEEPPRRSNRRERFEDLPADAPCVQRSRDRASVAGSLLRLEMDPRASAVL